MTASAARDEIVILGVFVADTAFRAERMPRMGETVLGRGFALGPGGKGSNQAVAAARAGGRVRFISRLGRDAFAAMAHELWTQAGVTPDVTEDPGSYTGAAMIFIDAATGDNAIIVSPGAAGLIGPQDVTARADAIRGARIFMTQLEQPMDAAMTGLRLAREGGATTILNPAPAAPLPDGALALCDLITPNESEAALLTGLPVDGPADAERAARALRAAGAGAVVVTLGEKGALYVDASGAAHVPPFHAGQVVETTGAGDAFNAGMAVALAEGRPPLEAARFGCATAAISVTRAGAAAAMPTRAEIEALLAAAR
ncbi:MAG: ribokinase [Rubrimonas sp.]